MVTKTLREYAIDFVRLKKASGLLFDSGEYHLNRYLKHHETYYSEYPFPTYESIHSYINLFDTLRASNISYVNEFCRYLRNLDIDAYVYHGKVREPEPRPPYIISESQMAPLFHAIDSIQDNSCWRGKSLILPAFYRFMWCCGVRTKEGRDLLLQNVDLAHGYIDIMKTKNKRDRRIMLSDELISYFESYNNQMNIIRPYRIYFFPGAKDDVPIGCNAIANNYRECWYRAFPDFDRTIKIRPYDFRHHFVYANINRWFENGEDINNKVYYLMQVTGHKDIHHLLYYFHLNPEMYAFIEDKTKELGELIPAIYLMEEE